MPREDKLLATFKQVKLNDAFLDYLRGRQIYITSLENIDPLRESKLLLVPKQRPSYTGTDKKVLEKLAAQFMEQANEVYQSKTGESLEVNNVAFLTFRQETKKREDTATSSSPSVAG